MINKSIFVKKYPVSDITYYKLSRHKFFIMVGN